MKDNCNDDENEGLGAWLNLINDEIYVNQRTTQDIPDYWARE